jgi:hypothetical protein
MLTLPERQMAQRAEHARSIYFAEIPTGITFEQCLEPTFWAHCVGRLKKNTMIELVAEDGSFDALVRVTDRDVGFAKLRVLYAWKNEHAAPAAGETETSISEKLPRILFVPSGATKGWRLLGFDGNTVKEGIIEKASAQAELEAYKQRAAA